MTTHHTSTDDGATHDGDPPSSEAPLDAESATYAVLSRCWREPTVELVDAVNEGALESVLPGVTDVEYDELHVEYSRLLLGPGEEQIPPYESVYRDSNRGADRGPVLGSSTRAVLEWYRSHGLTPGDADLPDHIATELEFVAHLSQQGESEARERFLAQHLEKWIDRFLDEIAAETTHPYYDALAAATRTVVSSRPE